MPLKVHSEASKSLCLAYILHAYEELLDRKIQITLTLISHMLVLLDPFACSEIKSKIPLEIYFFFKKKDHRAVKSEELHVKCRTNNE